MNRRNFFKKMAGITGVLATIPVSTVLASSKTGWRPDYSDSIQAIIEETLPEVPAGTIMGFTGGKIPEGWKLTNMSMKMLTGEHYVSAPLEVNSITSEMSHNHNRERSIGGHDHPHHIYSNCQAARIEETVKIPVIEKL